MASARADLREGSTWRRGLPITIVSPASQRAVAFQPAGIVTARAEALDQDGGGLLGQGRFLPFRIRRSQHLPSLHRAGGTPSTPVSIRRMVIIMKTCLTYFQ